MATRSNRPPKQPKVSTPMPQPPAPPPQPDQQQDTSTSAPTIRKGIYLSALIYIEGNQPAPDDFTALTTSALKQVLGSAFQQNPQGLTMTLKSVQVRNDVEDGDGDGESKQGGGFQF